MERPLLLLAEGDYFTLRNAFSGVGIFGATGTGKTTGSGQALAREYLACGMGGLVLCAKPSEARQWVRWAKQEGREKSIIRIRRGKNMIFDFLGTEMRRKGGGDTENILHIFNRVIEITSKSDLSQGENAYFFQACQNLLRNAISLCKFTYGRVTLIDVYTIIISAPTSQEQLASEDWNSTSEYKRAMAFCENKFQQKSSLRDVGRETHELVLIKNYFESDFARMGDRHRSSITSIFTSNVSIWLRGELWELFGRSGDDVDSKSGKTPFYLDPQHCISDGAIYLFDYPVKESYVGRLAQSLYKYMWQLHMERRDVDKDGGRGVFLWADEAQLFVLPDQDSEFAQTARSSRVATVLLSQNVSNYYTAFGEGEHGVNQAESLFGNLGTLIFHANTHEKTNRWASSIIGSDWTYMASTTHGDSTGRSTSEQGGSSNDGSSSSLSYSMQLKAEIEPREFTLLATGGDVFNYQVEAVITQAGRVWNQTDSNYLYARFYQHPDLN